jgi:hypothetical protein
MIVPKAASNFCIGRLSEQFSGSQADFGTYFYFFRVLGGYRIARTSFLKRVTGRVFTISK